MHGMVVFKLVMCMLCVCVCGGLWLTTVPSPVALRLSLRHSLSLNLEVIHWSQACGPESLGIPVSASPELESHTYVAMPELLQGC